MYQIIDLAANAAYVSPETGNPVVFPSTELAGAEVKRLSKLFKKKFKVQPVDVVDWRKRERDRFVSGLYIPTPWHFETWFAKRYPDHFAHISLDEPGKVAFTEDEAKGLADRQTRMSAGKYLKRFFGDSLSENAIRDKATAFAELYEKNGLKFATTPDEIERVYNYGPSSCMSGKASIFFSSEHPVRIYGAGDLAIAFLERDNRITARAICWPEKKVFGRLYGDDYRLRQLLIASGFKPGVMFDARLLRIPQGIARNRWFICPYIDDAGDQSHYVRDDGEFLRLTQNLYADDSEIRWVAGNTHSQCGLTTIPDPDKPPTRERDMNFDYRRCGSACSTDVFCERCDELIEVEDDECEVYTWRYNTQTWCQGCCDYHTHYCGDENITVDEDFVVRMNDGGYWSQWHFDQCGGTCDATGINYPMDQLTEVHTCERGNRIMQQWCPDEVNEHARLCFVTNDYFDIRRMRWSPENGGYVGDTTSEYATAYALDDDWNPIFPDGVPTTVVGVTCPVNSVNDSVAF